MKKTALLLFFALLCYNTTLLAQWTPAGDKIKTVWGEQLDPNNVLQEYPRPIMERNRWMNLNGLWDFTILSKGMPSPQKFDREILVPFAVESSLSGVGERVDENQELWYSKTFEIPKEWEDDIVLLHFGGVDWQTDVWVNDVKVGRHQGAYTAFSFDITSALKKREKNNLVVRVWDPTDKGPQPRGKQVSEPGGVWYTPVSGIWQTVWLEPVPQNYIVNLKTTPNIDANQVCVDVETNTDGFGLVRIDVYDGKKIVASGSSINGKPVEIFMPADAKLWSPDSPFLYDMKVSLEVDSKEIDAVDSYLAMRKYSMARDERGIMRLQLNNENIFHFGPLDQGWWPDGLYTAPSDEALKYDIQKTKDLGFNMIRKHVKVEPARWYTHCDKIGLIVWQDMPNGDENFEWQNREYFDGTEPKRSEYSEAIYRTEWKELIDYLYSYPCVGVWVPFNEAWGQFKTQEIVQWTKQYDPTRLINPASGGNHYTCGDILDLHNYPHPEMYLYDAQRVTVLGEYGGVGRPIENHLWKPKSNWGYIDFTNANDATDQYVKYGEALYELIRAGFSAAVYTQTTDVEIEVNGLLTYDRKVVKMNEKRLREINRKICNSLSK